MNTAEKLKICNKLLEVTVILMLVSGIKLEATAGKHIWTVWIHIGLGTIITIL